MFDLPLALRKKGLPHHVVWYYFTFITFFFYSFFRTFAFHPKDILKHVSKEDLLKLDIKEFWYVFIMPFLLYIYTVVLASSSNLLYQLLIDMMDET